MYQTSSSEFSLTPLLTGEVLRVDIRANHQEVVLLLCGDADLSTGPLLADALASGGVVLRATPLVVLDFEELRFIDAHCLGIIRTARTQLKESGRDLVVRTPTPFTRRLLGICGMDGLIEDSRDTGA